MTLSQLNARTAAWWHSKTNRDRKILGFAGAMLVMATWYAVFWSPLNTARLKAVDDTARIGTARLQLAQLPADVVSGQGADRDLRDIVTATTQQQGLIVQSIEARDDRVVVAFDTVIFDVLASWLHNIERVQGLQVVAARVERRPEPGTVSAEIELAGLR